MEINSAYLQKYTIRDIAGRPVNIDKHTSEGIVLVNERFKDKMSKIKKGYKELQELPDVWFHGKEVRYLFIKDNQKFLFLKWTRRASMRQDKKKFNQIWLKYIQ